MKGTPAEYLGRLVDKKHFRAFVHGVGGQRRLVESWDEYEACMQSGVWFATIEDALASKAVPEEEVHTITVDELPSQEHGKPKGKDKPKAKAKVAKVKDVKEVEEGEIAPDELDDMVYEVKDGE